MGFGKKGQWTGRLLAGETLPTPLPSEVDVTVGQSAWVPQR